MTPTTRHDEDHHDSDHWGGSSRLVDVKLPLHWMIAALVSFCGFLLMLGWQAAGQNNKLDSLIVSYQKLEQRLDERDNRLEALRDSMYAQQRITDANTVRIAALEAILRLDAHRRQQDPQQQQDQPRR